MSNIKDISDTITEVQTLEDLAAAYTEISSAKLNRIRKRIEQNEKFTQELAELFHLVREESLKRKLINAKYYQDRFEKFKQSGIVLILVTSNYRFYGGLENPLISYFINQVKLFAANPNIPARLIVVGHTGNSYLQAINFSIPYQKLSFKNDVPTEQEISPLINQLQSFQSVLVFYSRFTSMVSQIPAIFDVTQTPSQPKDQLISKRSSIHLFEPEIDKILEFFSSQIIKILFEQTFLESELSRTAYRLISMDQAQDNAKEYIKKQKRKLSLEKRSINNLRLLETIYSFGKWGDKSYE